MKIKLVLTSLFLLTLLTAHSQKNVNSFLVVSYNVENLFDTINSPHFDDDEFTPTGTKKWTHERYEKKLSDLARVIGSIPGNELPAIIGLAEIENRRVLEDLSAQKVLHEGKYKIVHEDGVDPRGIECALLYRPEKFKYTSHTYVPIEDTVDPEYLYRGILHVAGRGPDGSSLHIFMNHWKSRSGGVELTERQRMLSATILRKQLDLLTATEAEFKVILMGDFNDEPTNRSIINGLAAMNKRMNNSQGDLFNLHYDLHNIQGKGTYSYRGKWNMLDQIMVSYELLNQEEGLSCTYDSGNIFWKDWMMYDSERYGSKLPSSTYGGPEYYGGPADHLPIYVTFTW